MNHGGKISIYPGPFSLGTFEQIYEGHKSCKWDYRDIKGKLDYILTCDVSKHQDHE